MAGTNNAPENSPRNSRPDPWPNGPLPATRALPLDALVAYANEVLVEMTRNRDVKWDAKGKPVATLRSAGTDAECSWVHYQVDLSGIGLAMEMPLIALAYAEESSIAWQFGPTPIATTPRVASPKAAADTLEMDTLLAAFRRFVLAESVLFPTSSTPDAGRDKGPVFIDPEEGCCAECSGVLEVTAVADATLSVECTDCGEACELEHDAFDGTATDYVLEFLRRRGTDADAG